MSIKESTAKKNYSNKSLFKKDSIVETPNFKKNIKKFKAKEEAKEKKLKKIKKLQVKSLQKKFSLPGKKSAHPGGGSYGYKFYKD